MLFCDKNCGGCCCVKKNVLILPASLNRHGIGTFGLVIRSPIQNNSILYFLFYVGYIVPSNNEKRAINVFTQFRKKNKK